jgi:hypothetical protein
MVDVTIANHCAAGAEPSVPASNACAVTAANNPNDSRWTACQNRRGRRRIASDVSSIANNRYMPRIPSATPPGRQAVA